VEKSLQIVEPVKALHFNCKLAQVEELVVWQRYTRYFLVVFFLFFHIFRDYLRMEIVSVSV